MSRLAQLASGSILVSALFVGGCGSSARPESMIVTAADVKPLAPTDLTKEIAVAKVDETKETHLWTGVHIAGSAFDTALVASLKKTGLLSAGPSPRYKVQVEILGIQEPLAGFNMTVTSAVRYIVTDTKSSTKVFDDIVQVAYTASMSASPSGPARLRIATEGSARKNIAAFIEKLVAKKIDVVQTTEAVAAR